MITLQECLDVFSKALSGKETDIVFEKLKTMPFDASIHYPIIYLYVYYIMLEKAEELLDKSPYDETYLQLKDRIEALKECDRMGGISVFPMNVPWRHWWAGPHLNFPKESEGTHIVSWFPGVIDESEEDKNMAIMWFAKLVNNEPIYASIDIPIQRFEEEFGFDYLQCRDPETGPRIFVEVVEYGNGERLMAMHPKIWPMPREIAELHQIILPVLEETQRRIDEWNSIACPQT